MRRRVRWWWGGLVLVAACTCGRLHTGGGAPSGPRTLAGGVAAGPERLVLEAAERYPVLADYALWFRARATARAGHSADAATLAAELAANHPDSVWVGDAQVLRGRFLARGPDLAGARAALDAARSALARGGRPWIAATLVLAEVDVRLGDDESAVGLARDVRRGAPRTVAARRARRLTDRIRAVRPDLVDTVEEAETRLREGDPAGARTEVDAAMGAAVSERARLLWVRAQAEHALGDRPAAEATCLALAREAPDDPLAARALAAAATWRWNADDDAGALELFRDVAEHFASRPQAPEALYAMGRIAQEAGRYGEARVAYERVGERYAADDLAPEARWRAAWVRWLAGDVRGAERAFAALAARTRENPRAAAEYWHARALDRLGRHDDARAELTHVVDHHWTSYYAGAAEERLGRTPPDATAPPPRPAPPFPATLGGPHADRARVLAELGLLRFARREIDAVGADAPARARLEAYRAIDAVSPALRLAQAIRPRGSPRPLAGYLFPLGYWDVVVPAAQRHGVDPFLVAALIRQESLFDPDAVSPAGAHGLMQLLPSTAHRVRQEIGRAAPSAEALHDVATNIDLGVAFLAQLLGRYGGSRVKALAAYNGGEDAVVKWERRYAGREPDEFVELISFRETRDYVKSVLRNYRLYRLFYATPSPEATSAGSPPNAPFDMITMTSPGRALPIR
ncbi:MAG TPA: transglycosylase SLT domain-containing protein [Candidatus Binatia bacterium]|nr:transglycosylase SLT domain-containing protein [Candidatus Binatia bacterium]